MKLLRKNLEKQRTVYLLSDRVRKVWDISKKEFVFNHFTLLNSQLPGYAIDIGSNADSVWIDYTIIPGVPASTFNHTPEFIKRIYNFCLLNIEQTAPYYHGDWALSNIIINGEDMALCDWDNLGTYPKHEAIEKLTADLSDAFGFEFINLIK